MKKVVTLLVACAVFAAPVSAFAGVVRGGEEFRLGRNEVVADDLYAASGATFIDGTVNGDLIAAGGQVTVTGDIAEDVIIGGGTVFLEGSVADDVRIAGGRVEISGIIGDDLAAAGGQLRVLEQSVVAGNASLAGGKVFIDGVIDGDLKIAGGEVVINGIVHGKVEISAGNVIIGRTAMLDNGLYYRSPQEATIQAGAQIIGPTQFKDTRDREEYKAEFAEALIGLVAIIKLVKLAMFIVLVLALVLVFRTIPATVIEKMTNRFWQQAGTGFIVLVMTPVTIVLLVMTVLGIPIAFILALLYAIFLTLGYALGAIFLGAWLHSLIMKPAAPAVNWKTAIVGAIMWFILGNIPLIGWLATFIIMLAGLGGLTAHWYRNLQKNR